MKELNEVKKAIKYLELDAKEQADNFSASMIVSTKTILAIAEAFRTLEQRAEAAGAKLERKDPIAWIFEDELPENYPYDEMFPYSKVDVVRMFPVFGPAPAVSLAELVPDEMPCYLIDELEWRSEKKDGLHCYHMDNAQRSWDKFRAAILRDIKE